MGSIFDQLDQANASLQVAKDANMELGRLVPACSCCKKIRDDEAYWNELEEYLGRNADADLTAHGTCPECKAELYEAFLSEQGKD